MPKRKTVTVELLRKKINGYLEQNVSQEEKMALCTLLESVLFETSNYKGFGYQNVGDGNIGTEFNRVYY